MSEVTTTLTEETLHMIDGVSGLVGGTVATVMAVVSLDGATISVELAGTIFVSGCGLVWWLSARFTKIDDNQKASTAALERLKTEVEELRKILRNCPLAHGDKCETQD